jgi:Tfp pilus assembly protein PilF
MSDAIRREFAGVFQRALEAAQRGDLPAAAALFAEAIALDPSQAAAHANLGAVQADLHHWSAALAAFDAAIALRPDFALAHCNRGNAQRALGAPQAALESLTQAIALKPDLAEAYLNRGEVLRQLGRLDAALADLDHALTLRPGFSEALSNRGIVLSSLNRWQEALASCDAAIALQPDDAANHCNRGVVLQDLRRLDEALASFDRALALEPDLADARYNRSTVLLTLGRFEPGWAEFEWRWRLPGSARSAGRFTQARWSGGDSGAAAPVPLLLHCEQGLGDTLQFCRYAPMAARRGFAVHLEVQRPLQRLLARLSGVESVTAQGQPLPAFEVHSPLMSLPLVFGTTLADIPCVPYLTADPRMVADWARKLGPRARPRVGLVWSGGFRPDQPALWPVNGRRNVPLASFAPLARADVDFFSLQKGVAAETELAELSAAGWTGPRVIDHTASLEDFADTAALMNLLDLVIAVDTSSAHLAGALGKPVWLLSRFDGCWRWLAGRGDSPWYPSMTLYRQLRPGEWDEVLERVAEALVHFTT